MALIVSAQGLIDHLTLIRASLNTYRMRLYKNNFTPLVTSVLGDFTEANFSGYALQLTNAWGAIATVGDLAKTIHPLLTFAHNGGVVDCDVYGYYITDAGGNYIYAERNPAGPFSVVPGTTYSVLAEFTLDNT